MPSTPHSLPPSYRFQSVCLGWNLNTLYQWYSKRGSGPLRGGNQDHIPGGSWKARCCHLCCSLGQETSGSLCSLAQHHLLPDSLWEAVTGLKGNKGCSKRQTTVLLSAPAAPTTSPLPGYGHGSSQYLWSQVLLMELARVLILKMLSRGAAQLWRLQQEAGAQENSGWLHGAQKLPGSLASLSPLLCTTHPTVLYVPPKPLQQPAVFPSQTSSK